MALETGISTYSNPIFWERLCRIIITLDDGTILKQEGNILNRSYDGIDVSALHCTVKMTRNLLQSKQYGELVIYNLDANTEKKILASGTKVTVEAGYNHPDLYGSIFTANIIQTLRGKSNPTDYFVKLRFISDNDYLVWGITNFTVRRGSNYREILEAFAQNSEPQLTIDEDKMPEDWGTDQTIIKGFAVCNTIGETMKVIGEATNSIIRVEEGKVYAVTLEDKEEKSKNAFELNYNTGLIGQPTQTNEGVNFRSLLNPHILLNSWVHINNGYILQEERNIGENAVGLDLDTDGLYRVISQTYSLDTRGNDWYVDCDCISQAGKLPAMLGNTEAKGI